MEPVFAAISPIWWQTTSSMMSYSMPMELKTAAKAPTVTSRFIRASYSIQRMAQYPATVMARVESSNRFDFMAALNFSFCRQARVS